MTLLIAINRPNFGHINLIAFLNRAIRPGDQRNATNIWYLDFSKSLTITHKDRSCGQGGEMWLEQRGRKYICGFCNNGTQGMLINRCQLRRTLLVLPASELWS